MNKDFQEILDALPDKPHRSCLEPYNELIKELRRRRRTYREIAAILGEKFQLHVAPTTIVRFVASESRRKRKLRFQEPQVEHAPISGADIPREQRISSTNTASLEQVRQRIEDLKKRSVPTEQAVKRFHYDEDKPLTLVPKNETGKSSTS
jgi:hypothetical protein